jgi:VanZ family protein
MIDRRSPHSGDPRMRSYIITAARIAAWLLTAVIVVLSVVPAWLRPETDLPHGIEHFTIFFATGVAFGIGYSRKPKIVAAMLVIFAGAVELAQIVDPGRHARVSDFIVDALAACVGAALVFLVAARALEENASSSLVD